MTSSDADRRANVGVGGVCTIKDALYDRGSTFPLKCFLNNGASQPKIVGMPIFFRKMMCLYTWATGFIIGMQFDFCLNQFAAEVRSLTSEQPQKIMGEPLS